MDAQRLTDRRVGRILKEAQAEIAEETDVHEHQSKEVAESENPEMKTPGGSLSTGGQNTKSSSSSLLSKLKQRSEQSYA